MSTNAVRGAALVAVAVLLGALVLGWGLDDPVPGLIGTTGSAAADTTDDTFESSDDDADSIDEAFAEEPVETAVTIVPPVAPAVPVLSPVHATNEVSVQVANATGIDGLASRFSDRLQASNYVTRTPADAEDQVESVLYYEPGYDGDAAAILRVVFNSPNVRTEPMPVPRPAVNPEDANGSNILIVVGSDDLSLS